MQNVSKTICQAFKDARRALGLSQSVLANEIGCHQEAISMFERGNATKLSEEYVSRIAKRLGIDIIKPYTSDATEYNENLGLFDAVLCDVPCSGLGVIRRKPDIKYNAAADFTELEAIQRKILRNAVKYLKKDGRILYSTCTLRKAENENMIKDFLAENKDYSLITEQTLMPHINNTDGFYYALMEKIS